MYFSTARYHLPPLQEPTPPFLPTPGTPCFSGPTSVPTSQQRLGPTPAPPPPETRPRLLSLSSRDLPQKMSGSKPGPSQPSRGPARPAAGLPTHPQHPFLPPGGAGGGGGSRVRENPTKWRRPLEPRRDRALSRAPAHARASALCLLPLPPTPRRSETTNPTAAHK